MVQWLRARFNECYEKADFAKSKCADELPFVDKLLHDTARDMVCRRQRFVVTVTDASPVMPLVRNYLATFPPPRQVTRAPFGCSWRCWMMSCTKVAISARTTKRPLTSVSLWQKVEAR